MSAMLLQRANRPDPIRGPVSLLGRLAALGVGQSIERKNTEARQAAVMDMIGSLPQEQQAMAKLAVLTGSDPTRAVLTLSGQGIQREGIAADREAAAAAAAGATFQDAEGRMRFKQTGELVPGEVAEGVPLDTLSPEAVAQKKAIAAAGKTNINIGGSNSKLGKTVAGVDADVAAGILTPEQGEAVKEQAIASASQSAGDKEVEKMAALDQRKGEQVAAAAGRLEEIVGGFTTGDVLDLGAAASYGSVRTQLAQAIARMRSPGSTEPSQQSVDAILATIPSSVPGLIMMREAGQDPIAALIAEARLEAQAAQGAPEPGSDDDIMRRIQNATTPEELDALEAELAGG
jgi:hypothetical protein